jgi:hypothetical protein
MAVTVLPQRLVGDPSLADVRQHPGIRAVNGVTEIVQAEQSRGDRFRMLWFV